MTMMAQPEYEHRREPHHQLVLSAHTRPEVSARALSQLTDSAFIASAASIALAMSLRGAVEPRDAVGGTVTVGRVQSRFLRVRSLRYQNPFELAQILSADVVGAATLIATAVGISTLVLERIDDRRARRTQKRDDERLDRIAKDVADLAREQHLGSTKKKKKKSASASGSAEEERVRDAWDSLALAVDDSDESDDQKRITQSMISGFRASRRIGSAFVVLQKWHVDTRVRTED